MSLPIIILLAAIIILLVYVSFFKKPEEKKDDTGLKLILQQLNEVSRTVDGNTIA
jgi:hypothetical protein